MGLPRKVKSEFSNFPNKEKDVQQIKLKGEEKRYKFRKGSFNDTSYKDTPELQDEWEQFYLPDHMRMEVIGVVEKFPCCADDGELVLMVCEDGKVFGYEEELLHLVSNSRKSMFEDGIQFPGTEHYYHGQRFENMTDEDWDEVDTSEEIIKKNKEHKDMLESIKSSYLENLEIIEKNHATLRRDPVSVSVC